MKIMRPILSVLLATICASAVAGDFVYPNNISGVPAASSITAADMEKMRAESSAVFSSPALNSEILKAQKISHDALKKFDPSYKGLDKESMTLNMPKMSDSVLQQKGTMDIRSQLYSNSIQHCRNLSYGNNFRQDKI